MQNVFVIKLVLYALVIHLLSYKYISENASGNQLYVDTNSNSRTHQLIHSVLNMFVYNNNLTVSVSWCPIDDGRGCLTFDELN